jgi:DUF4097 and DUF4098 domain-containing protein YvlB
MPFKKDAPTRFLRRLAVPSLLCPLLLAPALALETAERTLAVDAARGTRGVVRIENLLGSVRLVSGTGVVRVEARAVAEAATPDEARALVDAIRLDRGPNGVHVAYPLDRTTSFRPPKDGMKGLLSRWTAPVLRRKHATVEYGGRAVEITAGRKATGLAVHLTVHVPLDAAVSVLQAAGAIHCENLRGDLRLETVSGDVAAERVFGTIDVATEDGDVSVTSFQGKRLAVRTGSGNVDLLTVRAEEARLATGAGAIRGEAVMAGDLEVESVSGDVELRGVEPGRVAARTESGKIDLATQLSATREADIRSASGGVTLRVGELSHFDLLAETESGEVKTLGLELAVVELDGRTSRLRHGAGGKNLRVNAPSVVVRPYEGSKLDLLIRGDSD